MVALLGRLSAWLQSAAALAVVCLLLTQVIIVALRYVFSVGWPWALDLLVYLFFFSVLLPGLRVLSGNSSIRVDVLYAGWSPRRRVRVDRIALLFLLFPTMGFAAWASLGTTVGSWRLLEASPTIGGLPGYFILKTALTLFFAAMALLALALAMRREPYGGEDER